MGRDTLKVTADADVLLRVAVRDDVSQAKIAEQVLKAASTLAITLQSLCEFGWVLGRGYYFSTDEISFALEKLLNGSHVVVDLPAVEAGLAAMRTGCDFADGVIAYEGGWLGGEIFVSFDRKAVSVWRRRALPRSCCDNSRPSAGASLPRSRPSHPHWRKSGQVSTIGVGSIFSFGPGISPSKSCVYTQTAITGA